ncbi:hypothetical protein L1887_16669 [Cichorium endivia]|nr:hypothetical protein L1887_16669 [Cichorium endivia]
MSQPQLYNMLLCLNRVISCEQFILDSKCLGFLKFSDCRLWSKCFTRYPNTDDTCYMLQAKVIRKGHSNLTDLILEDPTLLGFTKASKHR